MLTSRPLLLMAIILESLMPLVGGEVTAQSFTPAAIDTVFKLTGERLGQKYSHASSVGFLDKLVECASGIDKSPDCRAASGDELNNRRQALMSVSHGFSRDTASSSLSAILQVREKNRLTAMSVNGKQAQCGGPTDIWLATIVTLNDFVSTDKTVKATVFVHDLTQLGGCPTGVTLFDVLGEYPTGGKLTVTVTERTHYQVRPDGPPRGLPYTLQL